MIYDDSWGELDLIVQVGTRSYLVCQHTYSEFVEWYMEVFDAFPGVNHIQQISRGSGFDMAYDYLNSRGQVFD